MVFSSQLFLFYFLPLVLLAYYAMPRRGKHLLLTCFSYLFYGWANPYFVFLMLASTLVDYLCGLCIMRGWKKRGALTISICSNLALLGFFKYFNFAYENYQALAESLGFANLDPGPTLKVTLPLGISFYTFQSMSYSIDVYRGHARGMRNFIDFACYVSMFPQLVAGPIIRFAEVADQLRNRSHTLQKFARGIAMLSLGMAKKVMLANPCGKVADLCFDADSLGVLDAWYGVLAYAMQIYFDFSGYSDMAIGLGLMLGFVFAKNFDSPYISQSITEFWRRWHISLSSWLRDYLYVPLGGNRLGSLRTYVNLALVMLLGGLWHGASWNFVIWGGIHGSWLALERMMGKNSFYMHLPGPLRVGMTFTIVLLAWVFFRSADLPAAMNYLAHMFGLAGVSANAALLDGIIQQPYYLACVAIALLVCFTCPQSWDWSKRLGPVRALLCMLLLWGSMLLLFGQSYNPFIYFIF